MEHLLFTPEKYAHQGRQNDQLPTIVLEPHQMVWSPSDFTIGLARFMSQFNLEGQRVLDLACGSGFLSIAALKFGADQVTGVDLNPHVPAVMTRNWELNGLPESTKQVYVSDCCQAIDNEQHRSGYDLLVCNPPTLPMKPETDFTERKGSMAWNEVRHPEGRLVLDAALTEGPKFVRPGGRMLVIATSTEGWNKTQALLDQNWKSWEVGQTLDLPFDSNYDEYVELWENDTEERIIEIDGQRYQRLYFINATKG